MSKYAAQDPSAKSKEQGTPLSEQPKMKGTADVAASTNSHGGHVRR